MTSLVDSFSQRYCKQSVPDLRTGYQVRVHQKIKEGNKERIQVFEGLVIRLNAASGVKRTFTVRKISEGVGVEKVFPLHSPAIVKIQVQRAHKVRRAKLHFLRDLSGKALRLKEIPLELRELVVAGGKAAKKLGKELEKEIERLEKEEPQKAEAIIAVEEVEEQKEAESQKEEQQ
jgi:large subunit ribosomal protein L19